MLDTRVTFRRMLLFVGSVMAAVSAASVAHAGVILFDNFNSDAHLLNWPGNSVPYLEYFGQRLCRSHRGEPRLF